MLHRFLHNKTAVGSVGIVILVALLGIFAPVIAPHDPYAADILHKFAPFSLEYPLGTDNLGRCILSRMLYGIRPTLGLAVLTMLGTIGLGALMGLQGNYRRTDHAGGGCDVIFSKPDHGICSGGTPWNQCPECDLSKCIYQMGLVCPYDPDWRYAVPGPEFCPVLQMYWNTGTVYPGTPPDSIHCGRSGSSGVIGCGLGNYQYFNVVLLRTGRSGTDTGVGSHVK